MADWRRSLHDWAALGPHVSLGEVDDDALDRLNGRM